ncbi:hypothetical protein [Campylobacter sp. JMF_03 NE3]|uniref:hypothetical protein n=1 Tax=Campylobacter sp. JMF_03 NE3 TaxID=2983831 RepID=UPI0022E9E79C|nr:hypothetical protein [Campylobacter sp. JMF_03 NE3]MDA3053568.1 hypothetical protein [Campylobacter sp. JMF_03 NE3]
MANLADFELKAKGSAESLLALKKVFENGNDENHPFDKSKNFLPRIDDGVGFTAIENDTIMISGCCAWSVDNCMLDNKNSYYNKFKDDPDYKEVTNVQKLAKELNLEIEIFGNEIGGDFAEYYRINNNGKIISSKTIFLTKNAIKNISKKFDISTRKIHKYIESLSDGLDESELDQEMLNLYDTDYEDYVFDDSGIYYPAYYVIFNNSVRYGEFTI